MDPKFLPLYGIIPLIGMIGYVVYNGRAYRIVNDPLMLDRHRGGINCVTWLMVLAICLLEFAVQTGPHTPLSPLFWWVHLPLVVAFAVLALAVRFVYNGHKSASHGTLAYVCLALFGAVAVTGSVLWYQRFM
ncbi:MAG: hypothetical protein JWL87_210 [Candidatus Adlerbacteria bacterium]|nr:hypothetical protein [Candidatus Adlerbacteria bacterium]